MRLLTRQPPIARQVNGGWQTHRCRRASAVIEREIWLHGQAILDKVALCDRDSAIAWQQGGPLAHHDQGFLSKER
ncbi:MAG: hypothetical protein H0X36_02295 [Sphingomonadaceae bacterium]|nr:hypothetical protein [Sphingomonadaceae bacterium]